MILDKRGRRLSLLCAVRELMRREWRCVFEPLLLEGMLYEMILGKHAALTLSICECRERAAELRLPSPAEIGAASREAVRLWGED